MLCVQWVVQPALAVVWIWCIFAIKSDIWWQQIWWFSWEQNDQISCIISTFYAELGLLQSEYRRWGAELSCGGAKIEVGLTTEVEGLSPPHPAHFNQWVVIGCRLIGTRLGQRAACDQAGKMTDDRQCWRLVLDDPTTSCLDRPPATTIIIVGRRSQALSVADWRGQLVSGQRHSATTGT